MIRPFKIKWVIKTSKTKYLNKKGGQTTLLREAKTFDRKNAADKNCQNLNLPDVKIIMVKITARGIYKYQQK